jgi:hypothetical protein
MSKQPKIRTPKNQRQLVEDVKIERVDVDWLSSVYDPRLMTNDEIVDMIERVKYKGYNREQTLKLMAELFPDPKLAAEIIVTCALKGPQRAAVTVLRNGTTLVDMGIPASGVQGTDALSCNRIIAATADLAAYYLKIADTPKRLDLELPGWLQFPSAGAIKLPPTLRKLHVEFHMQFSKLIGGIFNEQIYNLMVMNSYLDENLGLFAVT